MFTVLTPLANRLVTPVGAHEVIQAQCLDDDTEQAQLLGVLGGVVSAVRSATGAGLCDTIFLYPVTVVVRAKCSDSLGLFEIESPENISKKVEHSYIVSICLQFPKIMFRVLKTHFVFVIFSFIVKLLGLLITITIT